MRRLKRVLGVTAIILALLIAAIPDMGRAEGIDDSDPNLHIVGGHLQESTFDGYVTSISGTKWPLSEIVNVTTNSTWGDKFQRVLDQKKSDYDVLGGTAFTVDVLKENGDQVSGSDCFSDDRYKWASARIKMAAKPVMVPMYGDKAWEPVEDAQFEIITDISDGGYSSLQRNAEYGEYFYFAPGDGGEYMVIFYKDKSDSGDTASTNATTGAGTGDTSSAADTASTSSAADTASTSSAADTASTAGTGDTSSAADTASTGGTGSTEPAPVVDSYSFTVNDSPSYAFRIGLIDGAGASGILFPQPTEGKWVLTVADNAATQLRQICETEVGLSSSAPYQGFMFSSLTKDLLPQAFPDNATLLLTMPLPDSLNDATSIDVRKLTSGHAQKVQAQIIPTRDVTDATNNRNYVEIVIPYEKFELGVPYILFATPDEVEPYDDLTIEVDTPRDTEPEEEVPVGTSVDVSEIWGLGTPTAQANDLEVADYRLLITRYTEPAKQQIYSKIVEQSAATGYKKAKSTIRVYDIRLKKTTKDGYISYPETEQELDYGTVSITLPIQDSLMKNSGTIGVYTLRNGSVLEVLRKPAGASGTVTFTAAHFSQFALLYTQGTPTPNPNPNPGTSKSSTGSSSSSSSSSSSASNSSSSTGASNNNNNATTNSNSNNGTSSTGGGGGGNRAGGDATVDMPRTGDATTYKAIIIMILLAFGAFELISSLPATKKQRAQH